MEGVVSPVPTPKTRRMMEGLQKTYSGKRVLVTGHTGFKGSWLCEWLLSLGAEVYGFALPPPTKPSLFNQLKLSGRMKADIRGDIRDLKSVLSVVRRARPDFVFHLAAQPLVRYSYAHPIETFDANVMGTANLLEAVRIWSRKLASGRTCSVICVTTDKVYENNEKGRPFKESDPFGGYDPYSASKGACEIVISSYRRSFFNAPANPVWVASARAGNVIGGGDWAKDRIVPDCMRALGRGEPIPVRNKVSTRPWQHVLEPLGGYLALGAALASRRNFADYCSGFNFGPTPAANRTVKDLVVEVLKSFRGKWIDKSDPNAVHEAGLLNLDIRKARKVLGWKPRWDFETTVRNTVEWYLAAAGVEDPIVVTQRQIAEYERS